jgi:hypothetical protein
MQMSRRFRTTTQYPGLFPKSLADQQSAVPSQHFVTPTPYDQKGIARPQINQPVIAPGGVPGNSVYGMDEKGNLTWAPKTLAYLKAPAKIVTEGQGPYPTATQDNVLIPGAMDERGNLWTVQQRPRHNWYNGDRSSAANDPILVEIPPLSANTVIVLENFYFSLASGGSTSPAELPQLIDVYDGLDAEADKLLMFSMYIGPPQMLDPNVGFGLWGGSRDQINLTKWNLQGLRPGRGLSIAFAPGANRFASCLISGYYDIPEF